MHPKQGLFMLEKESRGGDNYLVTTIGFEFVIGSRHNGLGPHLVLAAHAGREATVKNRGRN